MSVEDLLAHPLLWRGQEGDLGGITAIATGFAELDRYLPGGGWPLAGISEIFIERYGLGELRVLMPALAALSQRAIETRQWIVWIAPPFVPYAPALVEHGVDLSRILLVHPGGSKSGSRRKRKGADPQDALWAIEQVIRSRSSIAVLAWVKEADVPALRRLQLGAETYRCWTVLFRPATAMTQSSPATLRFRLLPVEKQAGLHIEIRKCRGRRPRSFLL